MSKEAVLEALAAFRNLYRVYGEKYNSQHMNAMQESFNRYLKYNKVYHGRYVSAKSPDFLK